jgi:acyl transferase domain-containing protein
MLAVALPLAEIETRLPGDISLAASNSPNITVISGPTPAIEAFKQKLEAEEIKTFPLHTSHAFHSAMMEPVLAPFARAFEGIALNPPSIPFISSMTGQWITDEQATSARYWGQQLRHPVLFSKGLLGIREEDNPLFIEVGPSAALSSAARQHIGADLRVITMLSPAQKPQPALETTLKALGQVWGAGVLPDWHSFYAAESRVRLSLPSYPFERVRHWIEPRADWASTQTASAPLAPRSPAEQASAAQSNEVVAQATASGNTVKTRLLRVLRDATGIEVKPSDEASTFLEIGFDSLLITQISAKIRKEFGIALQFRDLVEEYPNVKRLSQYLEQRVQPQAAATSTALTTPPTATPARSGQEHTAAVGQNGQPSPAPVDSTLAQVVAEQSETIRRLLGLLERTQLSGTPTAQTLQDQARQAARPNWRADQPPVPGARLGRDPAGNPGWYVPDPERAGQYLRVGTHDQ